MMLKNKTALVYGAGGAVGAAVARAFAREGATVLLSGRTAPALETTAAGIRAAGGRAEITLVDALDETSIRTHLETSVTKWGPLHVMLNAIAWDDVQGRPLTEMTRAEALDVVMKGVTTSFLTGTAVARHMAAHGGGVIIGVTATAGCVPMANVGGFGVACAAVEQLLRQLAVENGPSGVRVCFVRSAGSPDAPGLRDVVRGIAEDQGKTIDAVFAEWGSGAPLRRLPALSEVADAAVLLASDYARGMTNTLANVTCGAYLD
jgi:NAD(P)-dependent dehydrogenase (short-subunit alcohol dehydrogenase family)